MFETRQELKDAKLTISTLNQEVHSLQKQNEELRELVKKRTIQPESFYTHIDNTLLEWQGILDLVRQSAFKALCRFLAQDAERQEQEIAVPTEMHKFWHLQGVKSVLHSLLTFEAQARKQMEFIASGGKVKPEAVANPTVDYTS